MKSAEITGGSGFPSCSCRGIQIKYGSYYSCPFPDRLVSCRYYTPRLHAQRISKQSGTAGFLFFQDKTKAALLLEIKQLFELFIECDT